MTSLPGTSGAGPFGGTNVGSCSFPLAAGLLAAPGAAVAPVVPGAPGAAPGVHAATIPSVVARAPHIPPTTNVRRVSRAPLVFIAGTLSRVVWRVNSRSLRPHHDRQRPSRLAAGAAVGRACYAPRRAAQCHQQTRAAGSAALSRRPLSSDSADT